MFCGSSYPQEPYEEVPENVRVFAESAAQRLLHTGLNMITVDVASSVEKGEPRLHTVEIGGVNSWGLYGSNIDHFIHAMD